MTDRKVVWTQELADASRLLANGTARPKYQEALADDVRSRAREMMAVRPGTELLPHQLAYVSMVTSRLHGFHPSFEMPGCDEFQEAWTDAWTASDYEAWRSAGRDVEDLRDYADVAQIYSREVDPNYGRDEPVPGRMYEPGFIEITNGYYMVVVGNQDILTASLSEAEHFLWNEYAKYEVRRGSKGGY